MNMARVTAVVALIGFGMLSMAGAEDKVTLKMKYLPGTNVTTMKMDSTGTVTMDGKEMPGSKSSMTMVMEIENGKPDAKGQQELTITYTKIKQMTSAGGQEMSFDSEGDADKQDKNLAQICKPILGAKIKVLLDAKGEIAAVKGLDEMFDKMAKDNPAAAQMMAEMKKSFGGEGIKQILASSQKMLPEKPVSTGDTFENTMDMTAPLIGAMKIVISGKIKSIEKNVATIDFTGKAASKEATTQMGVASVTIKKMSLDQKGQMTFDIEKGVTSESTMGQTMEMEMSMKAGDQEKSMKMKQEMTITTTTVPK